ncbi:MAG: prefoldin subunit alpha [Candidatus Aenigmarchaeota archaeon]|nr:prefoldin subunit alpha [Candidatus Aenigmarchaeota archaeon]MCK5322223.1 prefoldin subunit alpha [Candidatus Aenigmarchaeota archaeon]
MNNMNKDMDAETQSKMYQFQVIQQQMQQLDQQKAQIQQRMVEFDVTSTTVDALKEEDKEIIFPLGGGLFVEGTRSSIDRVLVPVGAGVLVRKKVSDAEVFIKQRKDEMMDALEQIDRQIVKMNDTSEMIMKDIQDKSKK